MSKNIYIILPLLALGFACVGIAKPQWVCTAVACLLLAINALITS